MDWNPPKTTVCRRNLGCGVTQMFSVKSALWSKKLPTAGNRKVTHRHTHTHTHMRAHTHIHTYITHTYMHTHTHTNTYIRTYIHAYVHTYIHTYTHTHTHADTRVRAHTHIHTYVHTYTHTYTHIHTRCDILHVECSCSLCKCFCITCKRKWSVTYSRLETFLWKFAQIMIRYFSLCWLQGSWKINYAFLKFPLLHLISYKRVSRTETSFGKDWLLKLHLRLATEACGFSTWGSFSEYLLLPRLKI